MALLSFVFETIRPRANDPANQTFWLPGVLDGIDRSGGGGKLLPLEEQRWDLGAITGSTGTTISTGFADNWATYLEKVQHVDLSSQYPIADPAAPAPRLTLGGAAGAVVIHGLDNVLVEPARSIRATSAGYEVVLRLQLAAYDGASGGPKLAPLSLAAPYTLEQKLCTSSDGTTSNGNVTTDIVGGGAVSIAITNAWIDATVALVVSGTGAARTLAVQLTGIALSGPTPGSDPELVLASLTIDASVSDYLRGVWATLATRAIESDDGQAGIFQSVTAAINEPSFLGSLSDTLTSQLAGMLDQLFGPVTGGLPADTGQGAADAADQYLEDRIRYALDAPASSWYLPRLLGTLTSPRLEPLSIASIGLPPVSIAGLAFTAGALTGVVVNGLTHLETPSDQIVFGSGGVAFTAKLGALTATGAFSMSAEGQTLAGTFTVTVSGGLLAGAASATGASDADLTVSVASLEVQVPDLTGLVIAVQIKSAFAGLINSVLDQPGPQQAILDGLDNALAGQLATIGAQVTAYARSAIAQQLS